MKEFLLAGEEYVFTADGVEYYTTCFINMYSYPHVEFIVDKDNQYYISIQGRTDSNGSPVFNFNTNTEFTSGKLERIIKEIKTIDAKYINIDWNGNNSPIKNRTHYSSYDYEKVEAVFDGEL
jgi:hypothetical protein